MTDLDFEELDAAIAAAAGEELTAEPELKPEPSPAPQPKPNSVQEKPATAEAADVPESPAPAVRRGRFMEMVHPASDMRSAAPLPNRADKMPVVQIVSDSPETAADADAEAELTEVFTENVAAVPSPAVEDAIGQTDVNTTDAAETEADYESPFLGDAAERVKDAKRPLGSAASRELMVEEKLLTPTVTETDASTDDIAPQPDDDIAAIAIDTDIMEDEPEIVAAATGAEATPPADQYVANEPDITPPATDQTLAPDDQAADMLMPTKPPQMARQASEIATSPYAAATIDQTNIKPRKKHHVFLWIFAALLLLALGAGVGVALYLLGWI
jgi:hypothetical protein